MTALAIYWLVWLALTSYHAVDWYEGRLPPLPQLPAARARIKRHT